METALVNVVKRVKLEGFEPVDGGPDELTPVAARKKARNERNQIFATKNAQYVP